MKKEVKKINLENNSLEKAKIIFDDTIKVDSLKESNLYVDIEKDSLVNDSISVVPTDLLKQTLDSLKVGILKTTELDSVIVE